MECQFHVELISSFCLQSSPSLSHLHGFSGSSFEGSAGPESLSASDDVANHLGDRFLWRGCLLQQQALDVGRHHRQSVLEMGLLARLAMFVRAFVPSMVAVTGEPPGHGVQGEAGIAFLFHSPLAWSMEVFHLHPLFGHLVPFFHAPSCAIPLRQLRDGVLLRIQQGGSEDEDRFADEVFHQPKAVCTTGGECAFAGGISITTSSRSPWMKWSMSAPVFRFIPNTACSPRITCTCSIRRQDPGLSPPFGVRQPR